MVMHILPLDFNGCLKVKNKAVREKTTFGKIKHGKQSAS